MPNNKNYLPSVRQKWPLHTHKKWKRKINRGHSWQESDSNARLNDSSSKAAKCTAICYYVQGRGVCGKVLLPITEDVQILSGRSDSRSILYWSGRHPTSAAAPSHLTSLSVTDWPAGVRNHPLSLQTSATESKALNLWCFCVCFLAKTMALVFSDPWFCVEIPDWGPSQIQLCPK